MFELIKKYYDSGLWSLNQVHAVVGKAITPEEYEQITGKDYETPSAPEIIDSHPVGSIYMSVADTNPSELFPGTEWTAWGEGRVPVGVAASGTFNTVEKTGGAETHTLTSAQMPKHLHRQRSQSNPPDNPATAQAWNYSDPVRDSRQKGNVNSVDSAETGGDGAHNNLQPYITCYMWKRTA